MSTQVLTYVTIKSNCCSFKRREKKINILFHVFMVYRLKGLVVGGWAGGGGMGRWVDLLNRKEGNVLFNDALNTFYFTVIWCWTYGKEPLR